MFSISFIDSTREEDNVSVNVKRRDASSNMEQIEKEFAVLKENFFSDTIEALDKEYESIEDGTNQA